MPKIVPLNSGPGPTQRQETEKRARIAPQAGAGSPADRTGSTGGGVDLPTISQLRDRRRSDAVAAQITPADALTQRAIARLKARYATPYIRTLSYGFPTEQHIRFSINRELSSFEKKMVSSTSVGIAPFKLFGREQHFGLVFKPDAGHVIGYKKDMHIHFLDSDDADSEEVGEYAENVRRAMKLEGPEREHALAQAVRTGVKKHEDDPDRKSWGINELSSDPEVLLLKYHEMKLRVNKELPDMSSKHFLVGCLRRHLGDSFDEKNLQPFSHYENHLLSKLDAGEEDALAYALLKLKAMSPQQQQDYLRAGCQAPSKKSKYDNAALPLNEHLLLIKPLELGKIGDIAGVFVQDNEASRKRARMLREEIHRRTGVLVPYFRYDPASGEVAEVAAAAAANFPASTQPQDAKTILHERLTDRLGLNPGGKFLGADGITRYVKFYENPVQSYCELLTNRIYAELYIDAPACQVFMHEGKLAFASVWRDDLEGDFSRKDLLEQFAPQFLSGFFADVLTANWDVLGTLLKNVAVAKNGKVVRLDNGSGLLMRALGEKKPQALLQDIGEIENFFSDVNQSYQTVLRAAGYNSFHEIPHLKNALEFDVIDGRTAWNGWENLVREHAPEFETQHPQEFQAVVDMLEARTEKFRELLEKELYLPPVAVHARRLRIGGLSRRLLTQIPNTKFHLRDQFYEKLSSVLVHLHSAQYDPKDEQVGQVLSAFANDIGMRPQENRKQLHADLWAVRDKLIGVGKAMDGAGKRLHRLPASTSPAGPQPARDIGAAPDDQASLIRGIAELRKQGATVELGKQIRQLLVSSGADAVKIGHTPLF